ncbi:MAG: TIGR02300 family protein, partial [Alphaproteobacteria bacterium]
MVKPEWGTKRICQSCGAKFYDFGRSPIVCPACGATFELESPSPRGR